MTFSPTETAVLCAGSAVMGWAACMVTGYIRQYLSNRNADAEYDSY